MVWEIITIENSIVITRTIRFLGDTPPFSALFLRRTWVRRTHRAITWYVLNFPVPINHQHVSVTDYQFTHFIKRHSQHANIVFSENNQAMRESYIMIDPHGRFFQNYSSNSRQGYRYSAPILNEDIDHAFQQSSLSALKFSARYEKRTLDVASWNTHPTKIWIATSNSWLTADGNPFQAKSMGA